VLRQYLSVLGVAVMIDRALLPVARRSVARRSARKFQHCDDVVTEYAPLPVVRQHVQHFQNVVVVIDCGLQQARRAGACSGVSALRRLRDRVRSAARRESNCFGL